MHTKKTVNSHLSSKAETDISVTALHESIISCISDATYEVGDATLKKLFQLVKSMKPHEDGGAISMWAEAYLKPMMMSRLVVEENPKCIYYILKIIFSWRILQFETINAEVNLESVLCFWKRLVLLNSKVMRSKTREILICCMATSVKQFVMLLRRSNYFGSPKIREEFTNTKLLVEALSCISSFTVLVKQHSFPSELVNMSSS